MPAHRLTDDELRRVEVAATALVASRPSRPGPLRSSAITESVRADIGRYLVLEVGETMLRLVAEVRQLRQAAPTARLPETLRGKPSGDGGIT